MCLSASLGGWRIHCAFNWKLKALITRSGPSAAQRFGKAGKKTFNLITRDCASLQLQLLSARPSIFEMPNTPVQNNGNTGGPRNFCKNRPTVEQPSDVAL